MGDGRADAAGARWALPGKIILKTICAALLLALVSGRMAGAGQDDPQLNDLFAELKSSATMAEAAGVEVQIWRLWSLSNDAAVDRMLAGGTAAMNHGGYDAALSSFNSVIELRPDFAEGWNKRATLYYLMGDYDRSIADVERTLDLEPRHFGALSGLGLIYTRLKDNAGALEAYERALLVNPHLGQAKAEIKRLKRKVKGEEI